MNYIFKKKMCCNKLVIITIIISFFFFDDELKKEITSDVNVAQMSFWGGFCETKANF